MLATLNLRNCSSPFEYSRSLRKLSILVNYCVPDAIKVNEREIMEYFYKGLSRENFVCLRYSGLSCECVTIEDLAHFLEDNEYFQSRLPDYGAYKDKARYNGYKDERNNYKKNNYNNRNNKSCRIHGKRHCDDECYSQNNDIRNRSNHKKINSLDNVEE